MGGLGVSIAERLVEVRGRIAAAAERAGRDPDDVALVAVSTLRAPSRLVRHADDLPTVEEALASADK